MKANTAFRRVPGLKKHASTSTSTTKTRPAGEASLPANKNGQCNGAALLPYSREYKMISYILHTGVCLFLNIILTPKDATPGSLNGGGGKGVGNKVSKLPYMIVMKI